jgi:hypothetical protein
MKLTKGHTFSRNESQFSRVYIYDTGQPNSSLYVCITRHSDMFDDIDRELSKKYVDEILSEIIYKLKLEFENDRTNNIFREAIESSQIVASKNDGYYSIGILYIFDYKIICNSIGKFNLSIRSDETLFDVISQDSLKIGNFELINSALGIGYSADMIKYFESNNKKYNQIICWICGNKKCRASDILRLKKNDKEAEDVPLFLILDR